MKKRREERERENLTLNTGISPRINRFVTHHWSQLAHFAHPRSSGREAPVEQSERSMSLGLNWLKKSHCIYQLLHVEQLPGHVLVHAVPLRRPRLGRLQRWRAGARRGARRAAETARERRNGREARQPIANTSHVATYFSLFNYPAAWSASPPAASAAAMSCPW